jgi:cytochrome c553
MTIRFLRVATAVLGVSLTTLALAQLAPAQPDLHGFPGSVPRHNFAQTFGIPARYASMRNPLPDVERTWWRGASVYAQKCASCHGQAGEGNGPGGRLLGTPPANLAWFATLPMSRWDGFMYWTIAEGGQPFGTAMPAYKKTLTDRDIWAVTAYIRQTLGKTRRS